MCYLCETKAVYEFTNKRKLCKACFVRWFEKKALYTIRKFKMINKNDTVGYEPGNKFREVVLEQILVMYSEKSRTELVKINKNNPRITKIALASSADSEAEKIVNETINGKGNLNEVLPVYGKIIKPLYLFLDKEILLYAKLKKLNFNEERKSNDKPLEFIDELEKKHPEIKTALVSGVLRLRE